MRRTKQLQLSLALILVTVFVAPCSATPIRPDLHKLLQEEKPRSFAPARAGWNGPEMRPAQGTLNPTLEAYGPAATARAARASLLAAVIPDPKAVIAIGTLIVLLRVLRQQKLRRKSATVMAIRHSTEEERQAA